MSNEKHIQELLAAEKEGRLVVLPVRLGSPVYTVIEDYFACNDCKHKNEAVYTPHFKNRRGNSRLLVSEMKVPLITNMRIIVFSQNY